MTDHATITRFGILEGIYDGDLDALHADIQARLLPLWKRLPHLRALRVTRGISADNNAPAILLVVEMDFPSVEALDEALASPERAAVRDMSAPVFAAFKGELYHLVQTRVVDEILNL